MCTHFIELNLLCYNSEMYYDTIIHTNIAYSIQKKQLFALLIDCLID